MHRVLEIVAHTPLWVWPVLALVLALGIARTRDRTTGLAGILVMPAIMALIAADGLLHQPARVVPAVLVGLAPGAAAGWTMEREGATERLPDGRIRVRGEWSSLLLILAIVAFRYASGVVAATAPAFAHGAVWPLVSALVSAFLAALFIARTAARLRACKAQAAAAA